MSTGFAGKVYSAHKYLPGGRATLSYQRSVRALLDHWDDLSGQLSADTLRYLFDLLARFGHVRPEEAAEAAAEIGRLLDKVLPHDGPVRRALDADADGERGGTATAMEDWLELASASLQRVEHFDLAAAAAPSPDEVTFWTNRWLLAEAALSKDDLRARGQDPDDRELLRLDRDGGGEQWPAFQFSPNGAPFPLVRAINRILDADDDPWGVADWWLGHNQWLDGVPARMIGQVADDLMVDAARAVDPGV